MFGGAGIFADGAMFALVHDGVIYLKTDAHNAPDFERENLGPFTYLRRGEPASLSSYRRMPDRLYDDPDELAAWARAALAAASGKPARKRQRGARQRPRTPGIRGGSGTILPA